MRYKEVKNFGDKKITIRLLSQKDLNYPEKFRDLVNSLVREDAQIRIDKKSDR